MPSKSAVCEVSVVLPAHNEARGIGRAVQVLSSILEGVAASHEIIVVDDGSRDQTFETAAALCAHNPQLRVLSLSRNFGKEAALLAGLTAASGRAVITMDADLQHPPALIPVFLTHWRNGAKVVHGVKEDRQTDSLPQRLRARVFNALLTRLGGFNCSNCSDYKLLDREVVDILTTRMPERNRLYRGLASWVGFRQEFVGFVVAERLDGASSFSLKALMALATTALVSFSTIPLRIVTFLGALTLLLGVGVAGEAFWSWSHDRAVSGFMTLIMTLLIIGSCIMISLGIIGEYVGRIYEELKARPVFLVERRAGFEE
ncbi:glycosyltransferase family 2 protein [Megalodesulfovibrio gigas]|uniref:Putative glycosyl transferase n=1 Tax=Megalodesulfovibrio gigas (strain ATCC 19364 / DSM 1382 / NCIMB 9332 / VKM B-1759) TaxID=1121448 RepID=T2GAV6_MEGG1|nr:glycosyltransferase family 2 protein [Megalodesulfovibrio gigas]AGW13256.1 putative glycosyl transferase [Megalodesulfovibrio gigas DSM 1382 = ATCC 19364]